MNAIIIDTTRSKLLVCLVTDNEVFELFGSPDPKRHTQNLLPMIEKLLDMHNLVVGDVQYLSAVTGPGSFTGIRIGVATANALAYALGAKLVDINSFEPIAYGAEGEGYAVIDAMHGNYYAAQINGKKIVELAFFEADEAAKLTGFVKQREDYSYCFELASILRQKISEGDFSKQLCPLYLRKSQAEREADND